MQGKNVTRTPESGQKRKLDDQVANDETPTVTNTSKQSKLSAFAFMKKP